jgi:YVTN family beta-propeller protein
MRNSGNFIERKEKPVLLVANKHSNTLSFVNPETFKVIKTIPTGPNPHEIAITPDQRFAYLSSYEPPGNTISVVDLVNKKLIKQINTGEYIRIHGVAIAPDGKNAYFTAGQSGLVVEVDTRTNEITRAIPTYGKISHMVYVSPDNKTLYTGNESSGDISVIDRASGKLIALVKTGRGAGGMAFSSDGKYIWVTNETDETIAVVDLAVNRVVETFKCAGIIKRIRFTDNDKIALITSWTKEGELIVFDVLNRREIKRIRVGDHAIGIEISPDRKYAFIGCEDSQDTKVLADGTEKLKLKSEGSDGVHVIDMQNLEVIATIKTGLGPDPMAIWFPPQK